MSSFKTKLKGFVCGALVVPTLGVVAHLFMGVVSDNYYKWNRPKDSDYSLKYRFETAYRFNTPAEHKQYTMWDAIYRDGHKKGHSRPYAASPYGTYPAMLGLGLLGARIAARRDDERKLCADNRRGR